MEKPITRGEYAFDISKLSLKEVQLIHRYLKEKRLYGAFYFNLVNDYLYKRTKISIYMKMDNFILFSFIWRETKEGHAFWERINKDFNLFIYNVKFLQTPIHIHSTNAS